MSSPSISDSPRSSETSSGRLRALHPFNLTGGTNILGADSRPGRSVAVDVGVFHTNDNVKFGDRDGRMNWGVCVSNVGAKMSYTETAERDFIPTNLKAGAAATVFLDDYNNITFTMDATSCWCRPSRLRRGDDDDIIVSGTTPTSVWPPASSRVSTTPRASWNAGRRHLFD